VTIIVNVPFVAAEVVAIVRVDILYPPDVGVTVVGLSEGVTPAVGAVPTQDQASEVGDANGFVEVTVIVLVSESPWFIESEVGEAEMLKSPDARITSIT